jgi:hypothetical protein
MPFFSNLLGGFKATGEASSRPKRKALETHNMFSTFFYFLVILPPRCGLHGTVLTCFAFYI